MALLGLSKEIQWRRWRLENGAATYIDSFHLRSYMVFSNVSHEYLMYRYWQPMLSLICTYKGRELGDPHRETICGPLPKLRFGRQKGMFANLTLIPKFRDLTNGFAGLEVGYKF